jgi:pimeloyl-ACP methyl ester carboxylesterase
MTTFGLVHGAYHGSWCWQQLADRLAERGHRVLTVDLPCEDPAAGASEYADAALDAFSGAPEDLVLVGHSLGGLTIPVVAARRPVGRMIFLCAMVPRPGRIYDDVLRDEPDMVMSGPAGGAYVDADGATRWHPESAAASFFADCPPALAAWAAARLRGQHWKITSEVTPIRAWPEVPCQVIIGSRDLVINPTWSRRVTPVVLGVNPIELDCGHSPFLSAPSLLAEVIAGGRAGADRIAL